MIDPSTSHTAGALRIGKLTGKILGEQIVYAQISLFESFAKTLKELESISQIVYYSQANSCTISETVLVRKCLCNGNQGSARPGM